METDAVYKAMLDARVLLDAHGEERSKATGERCIAFKVAGEYYAVDLTSVKEVITPPDLLPVPGSEVEVLGVINLRGSILTVVNARSMLGLDGCAEGPLARILVLDEGGCQVGALVDAVEDIVSVDLDALDPAPARRSAEPPGSIRGACNIEGQIAFVLRASALSGVRQS